MRKWSISISLIDPSNHELPANIFDKVTYHLHPTFVNPNRSVKKPPFRIEEQGWGEFDMEITLFLADKAGERKLKHDLNFAKNKYEITHKIKVPTNKPGLNKLLAESGPVSGINDDFDIYENQQQHFQQQSNQQVQVQQQQPKKRINDDFTPVKTSKKPKTVAENNITPALIKGTVDLEKLAQGLTKLNEDDLIGVVQMITDNRTNEMNIKNDVEEGEFHMDLFTLPDGLLKSLWNYVKKRVDV